MDKQIQQHIRFHSSERLPGAPHINLVLDTADRQFTTLPFHIYCRLRRSADDGSTRSCIFHWTPTIHGFSTKNDGFKLLERGTDGSVSLMPIDHSKLIPVPEETRPLIVTGHNQFLWELAPGQEIKFLATLPERYHKMLKAGHSYSLVWPGNEILKWDWGTIREHLNQEVKPTDADGDSISTRARLILPATEENTFSFTVEAPARQWPARKAYEEKNGFSSANFEEQRWQCQQDKLERDRPSSPPPVQPSERVPGAPLLDVSLECPPQVSKGETFEIVIKVTYKSASSAQDTRPIIFHIFAFTAHEDAREGYRLYRLRPDKTSTSDGGQIWETCDESSSVDGFMIFDDPDVAVHPSQHKDFMSLKPGESWTIRERLQGEMWTELPSDYQPGDVFRYRFKGTTVDWWDWGDAEEHANTTVKLPCFIVGQVTDPADNGGRPKLVVPASGSVEFKVVG